MSDPITRIVCINLGTRYVGLAAFQNHDLRDWRVSSFNGKWNRAKERKIVSMLTDYLDQWSPSIVVLKEIDASRSSPALNHLVDSATALLKERDIRHKTFSIRSLKNILSDGGKSKKALAEEMAQQFPVLGHELRRERENHNSYYQRMFEAVALGSICLGRLEKKN